MPPANNLGRGPSGVGANRNDSSFAQGHGRPAWHTFTPPQPGNVNRSSPGPRSSGPAAENGSSPARSYQSQSSGQQGGWEHFNPSIGESRPQTSDRALTPPNESIRRYQPPASASPGGSYGGRSYSYRPPLNMRQPIVTPRGGYSNGNGSYSSPRGPNSAPRSNNVPHEGGYNGASRGGSRGGSGGGSGGGSRGGGGGGHSR